MDPGCQMWLFLVCLWHGLRTISIFRYEAGDARRLNCMVFDATMQTWCDEPGFAALEFPVVLNALEELFRYLYSNVY